MAFNEPCTEREKGFIDVLLMEKLRDWYYTTPQKKNSIDPISNTKNILVTEKLHFLENYPHIFHIQGHGLVVTGSQMRKVKEEVEESGIKV